MDGETFSRALAEAWCHTGWRYNREVQLLAMGWLWLAMTQIRPRHIASQIPSLWQRGVMNMSRVTACYGIMQHSYWFISLSQSHRLPTVNIYWWHSHEFLIPTDPVSSNSVLSVLEVSCRAPLFASVQLRAFPAHCPLGHCQTEIWVSFYTDSLHNQAQWYCKWITTDFPAFTETWNMMTFNFSRKLTFKSEFSNQVLTFVYSWLPSLNRNLEMIKSNTKNISIKKRSLSPKSALSDVSLSCRGREVWGFYVGRD